MGPYETKTCLSSKGHHHLYAETTTEWGDNLYSQSMDTRLVPVMDKELKKLNNPVKNWDMELNRESSRRNTNG